MWFILPVSSLNKKLFPKYMSKLRNKIQIKFLQVPINFGSLAKLIRRCREMPQTLLSSYKQFWNTTPVRRMTFFL